MDNQYNYYNQGSYQQGPYDSGNQNRFHESDQRPKENREKKMPKAIPVIGLALLFGIVSSATFLTSSIIGSKVMGLNLFGKPVEQTSEPVNKTQTLSTSTSVVTSDVSAVVDQVMPSVVSITNLSIEEVQSFFGGRYQQQSTSAGTGIIVGQTDSELQIVTNNHVIEGSTELTVTFADETSAQAVVKGRDAAYDLAVIAVSMNDVSTETRSVISVATLGDSADLKVGEPAIAIGNALGYGQSVTTGVISALNRTVSSTDSQTGQVIESDVKLIQTDAAINPGNSGGALVNASGEVIGINSSKLVGSSVEGVGYAIPVSDVKDMIEEMMNQVPKVKVAEARQGILGIEGISVSSAFSRQLDMPQGVYVSSVIEGGGAAKAGMTKGCIITKINRTSIDSMDALKEELQYYAVGDTVTLTIKVPQTDGTYQEQTLDVTIGPKTQE